MTTSPSPHATLTGRHPVTLSDGSSVHVREATPADILDGKYVELLRTDYAALLDWICDQQDGWARSLSREDWATLREAEEQINFDFALAETKAAHARGQALKFLDEAVLAQSRKLVDLARSLSSSRNTARSPGPPDRRPAPSP